MINIVAILFGIAIYMAWYWVAVGDFCQAMWFGTAPIVIIGISFYYSRKALSAIARVHAESIASHHQSKLPHP